MCIMFRVLTFQHVTSTIVDSQCAPENAKGELMSVPRTSQLSDIFLEHCVVYTLLHLVFFITQWERELYFLSIFQKSGTKGLRSHTHAQRGLP